MALFKFLVAIIGLLGFGHQLVFAFPAVSPDPLVARVVPCNDISMYTPQFFLDNAVDKPEKNGLFYIGEWMESAIGLSRTEGVDLLTLWDIWDCKYYNKTIDVNNPLRCIFSDETKTKEYFVNMSGATAMLCNNHAWLMTDDPHNIGQDGVWGQVEYPTLELTGNPGGQVNTIQAMDSLGNSGIVIWSRDDNAVTGSNPGVGNPGNCYSPSQLTYWFGGIDW